jgi:putative endonuclease
LPWELGVGSWELSRVPLLHKFSGLMTDHCQKLGKLGESLAVEELERRGYAILARRYRTRVGEIDIVAEDGETLVFVEVKARATTEFGSAVEAVTRRKQLKLIAMASDYLARSEISSRPCRFDVVAIDRAESNPEITVYPHAFEVTP